MKTLAARCALLCTFWLPLAVHAEFCSKEQGSPGGTPITVEWYCDDESSCGEIGLCVRTTGERCLTDYQVAGSDSAVMNIQGDSGIPYCNPPIEARDGAGGGGADAANTPFIAASAYGDYTLHRGPLDIAKSWNGTVNSESPRDILYGIQALPLHNFCFADIGPSVQNYPACPSGPMEMAMQNGIKTRLHNVHACKGSDGRIYSIYTCPWQYANCSAYYGVCYRLDGYDGMGNLVIRSCQFSSITNRHWYAPEAECETQFSAVADDLLAVQNPTPAPTPSPAPTDDCNPSTGEHCLPPGNDDKTPRSCNVAAGDVASNSAALAAGLAVLAIALVVRRRKLA